MGRRSVGTHSQTLAVTAASCLKTDPALPGGILLLTMLPLAIFLSQGRVDAFRETDVSVLLQVAFL